MTKREFFEQVIATVSNKEIQAFAETELVALDKKNAKAKEKRMEVAKANEPILTEIVKYLENHKTALSAELAKACDISTPKAVAMCNKLVESGTISVREVSIPKIGKRKAYSLIAK